MTDGALPAEQTLASAREGQIRSPFTVILETLCDSCIGAIGAGLVDEEGESVDFAFLPSRDIPAYTIKLCGAYWQIAMRDASSSAKLCAAHGPLQQMWIQADEFSYVIMHMHAGYVLLLICRSDALTTVSTRALRQAVVEINVEAGWPQAHPDRLYWRRAHVFVDANGDPAALRYATGFMAHGVRNWDATLNVIRQLNDLADFERGYEVQTHRGETLHLVREPSGYWYAGAHPGACHK